MGPIIAFRGEIIARDFMTSYPSGEPAWKPGIKVPDGSTIGMQWGGDITPYVGLASWLNSANSPRNIQLVLPFIPCSRQDKTGPINGDQSEGVSYILSSLLQAEEVTSLVTLDNHSEHPIDHWRGKAVNLLLASVIHGSQFADINLVVGPDEGSYQRGLAVLKSIGRASFIWGTKKRDQASGRIESLEFHCAHEAWDSQPERILVVDDIIDGGYTFKLVAEKLRSMWPDARRELLCTHGVFSLSRPNQRKSLLPSSPFGFGGEDSYWHITTTDSCAAAIQGWNVHSIIPVVERLTIERSILHA